MPSYSETINQRIALYEAHFKPVDRPITAYYTLMPSTSSHFALRMTIINLLDALVWELDHYHTNADMLMQDSLDKADRYSASVY